MRKEERTRENEREMKIYVKDLDIRSDIDTRCLSKTSAIYNYIYSDEGLYLIQNNQTHQLIPNDVSSETYSFNDIEFIVDYSSYTFRKAYIIPFDHTVQEIERVQHAHPDTKGVSLVIERHNGRIRDLYFETRENKMGKAVEGDIIKYLSLFNDIKQS